MRMTRDFELIRRLLVFFDEKPDDQAIEVPGVGEEYSDIQIKYHLVLMDEAGFLNCEAERSKTGRVINVVPFNLTWEGHEFLAKIRSDGVWNKVQSVIASKGGTLAFAVINQLATKLAFQAAGL